MNGDASVDGNSTGSFDIVEDKAMLSSEAKPEFQKSKGLRIYVSLVLDMSSSTHDELPQLVDAAKAFVDELLVRRKLTNVLIGIDLFDGSATMNEWLLPISDAVRVKAKIDDLTNYMRADPSSTNLYGGVIDAVTKLQQRQVKVMSSNDNGVVTVGYAVLFTDGADTAARVPKSTAVSTLASVRFVDPSLEPGPGHGGDVRRAAGRQGLHARVARRPVERHGPNGGTTSSGLCSDSCRYAGNGPL